MVWKYFVNFYLRKDHHEIFILFRTVTLNFESKEKGHLHPISLTSKILEDIFISLGFKVEDGPQIETEEFNFDKLNIPDNHPARDVWDTFWIHDDINADKKV